jgi:hypothetical protein
VSEGAVEDRLEELAEGEGGGEGAVDLVQELQPTGRLALRRGDQLGGRAQHDRVRRARLRGLDGPGAGRGVEPLDGDHRLRDLDEVADVHPGRGGERAPVEKRRVPRPEVLDHPALPFPVEARVLAGQETVGEDKVGLRRAADHEGVGLADVLERLADRRGDAEAERHRTHRRAADGRS